MLVSGVEDRKEVTEQEEEGDDEAEEMVISEAVAGPPTVAVLPTVRHQTGRTSLYVLRKGKRPNKKEVFTLKRGRNHILHITLLRLKYS